MATFYHFYYEYTLDNNFAIVIIILVTMKVSTPTVDDPLNIEQIFVYLCSRACAQAYTCVSRTVKVSPACDVQFKL